MDPSRFHVRDREPIRPKLRAFVDWVVQDYLNLSVAGPGQRMHGSATGRAIVSEPPAVAFRGAFAVSLRASMRQARVGLGRVNGLVPVIDDRTLDGRNPATGKPDRKGVPMLPLASGPGSDGYSYIALAMRVDLATGRLLDDPAKAVTVVHVKALDPRFVEGHPGDDGNGLGLHPLAEIEWDISRSTNPLPRRARQMVFFDQTHRFIAGRDGEPGRHEMGVAA